VIRIRNENRLLRKYIRYSRVERNKAREKVFKMVDPSFSRKGLHQELMLLLPAFLEAALREDREKLKFLMTADTYERFLEGTHPEYIHKSWMTGNPFWNGKLISIGLRCGYNIMKVVCSARCFYDVKDQEGKVIRYGRGTFGYALILGMDKNMPWRWIIGDFYTLPMDPEVWDAVFRPIDPTAEDLEAAIKNEQTEPGTAGEDKDGESEQGKDENRKGKNEESEDKDEGDKDGGDENKGNKSKS